MFKGEGIMFCKNCGKYNPDGVTSCKYCGCNKLSKEQTVKPDEGIVGQDKTSTGVWFCLLLGILGLIIGLFMYREGTYDRSSFLSGWTKTLIVVVIIEVVITIIALALPACV